METKNENAGYIYPSTEARGLNFGQALEAAKRGQMIAREGWNGKNQYVFLAHATEFETDVFLEEFEDVSIIIADVLVLRTQNKALQPGWLATQSDMLAEDWYIYAE